MPELTEIDGSYGESGGQILRTSLSLSAVTGKPLVIRDIRAKRSNPGLQMQHLTCAKAVRSLCRGRLENAELNSTTLKFEPGKIVGGKYEFNIGTAGSVTLVAQTLIPILLNASKKSTVRITGGTHVIKSPGYDYFENLFIPAIRRFGADVSSRMLRPGYYPKGGGRIEVNVNPSQLTGCTGWEKKEDAKALIRLSGLPSGIAVREKKVFVQNGIESISIREDDALSAGNAVTLWDGFRGAYVPGEKGKRAEVVAQEAVDFLKKQEEVDIHLADQLLVYAVLAEGKTEYRIAKATNHLHTNAEIIRRFVPERRIEIEEEKVAVT
ncbi:RNA 3'-phosphate cyclase [Candidatus Micrarchaeota archaeon]|nr:RNA 3'-phosphate cyclase [Candidatus Micrarchaeota archaeon]